MNKSILKVTAYSLAASLLIFGVNACSPIEASDVPIPYPENYRDWRHVKTEVWGETHPLFEDVGGVHHIYANEKALDGYETNKFDDGSVFVFDLLDANITDGATVEGERKALFVMLRDEARFTDTGGWGFEGFDKDSKSIRTVGNSAITACYACHTNLAEDTQFVVSSYRK